MSEEALQTEERREVKSKGEKERYTQLNAEFQRIARRDKMAFFNDQSKDYQAYKDTGKYDPHATNQSTETNPEVTQMLD